MTTFCIIQKVLFLWCEIMTGIAQTQILTHQISFFSSKNVLKFIQLNETVGI